MKKRDFMSRRSRIVSRPEGFFILPEKIIDENDFCSEEVIENKAELEGLMLGSISA